MLFRSPAAFDRLDALGVRYVVLRVSTESAGGDLQPTTGYSERAASRILSRLPDRARTIGRFGNAYLIAVRTTRANTTTAATTSATYKTIPHPPNAIDQIVGWKSPLKARRNISGRG